MLTFLRTQFLTWIGIIGGVLTLFDQFQNFLELSRWASWLTSHWASLIADLWSRIGSLIGLSISADWAVYLTFLLSLLMTALGVRLQQGADERKLDDVFVVWLLSYSLCMLIIYDVIDLYIVDIPESSAANGISMFVSLFAAQFASSYKSPALARVIHAVASALLLTACFFIFYSQINDLGIPPGDLLYIVVVWPFAIPALIAEPGVFANRALFILVGLGLLMGMNSLGIVDLYAWGQR